MKSATMCLSYFTAKTGCLDELIDALSALIKPTLAEPNCLQYELVQDSKNPNFLIMVEKFTSPQALAEHESQPYIKQFVEQDMNRLCDVVSWHEGQLINSVENQ